MVSSSRIVRVIQVLRRLRRYLAPAGTLRERLVRSIYAPIIEHTPVRWRMRLERGRTIPTAVIYLADNGVPDLQTHSIRKILVLKIDHIGDLILSMRAMRDLRDGFPDAHITLVCASWNQAWARRLGWFDRIVAFDFFPALNRDWPGASKAGLKLLYDSVAALPLETYDLAIDLRHNPETRPCLYRIDATYRAGFQAPAEADLPCLDLVIPSTEDVMIGENLSRSLHAQLRLQVLAATVVAAFTPPRPHPISALLTPGARRATRPFAVIAVGAGDPIRCWPIERYADVGNSLIMRHGLDIVVLGGPAEQADAARLAAALPVGNVRTAIGIPLDELPELLAGAALCVCNGSGISHLAAALDVRTVCILGGTSRVEVWHPVGTNVVSVVGRTPCQPCGLREAPECPWDVACLTAITTNHVLTACERLLAG